MDNPSTIVRNRRYIGYSMVLSVLSFLLHLIAFVTPGWMVMLIDTTILYMGLWYMTVCLDSVPCETKWYIDIQTKMDKSPGLQEINLYQGLATSAIILSFIAMAAFVSVHVTIRRADYRFGKILLTSGILILISGILVIACVGKWADAIRIADNILANTKLKMEIPFSLIFGGLGGLCSIISASVLLLSRAWSMSPNDITGGPNVVLPPVYFENPVANNYKNMDEDFRETA